nr:ribonuclease H-like domain, reverse transcriptase, RNA-dependent DNA polymerase [Tanacetum cinerariifolium]
MKDDGWIGVHEDAFEKLMKDKFQMSSMGELTFFLGLHVKQKEDGIFISQDKYVDEILRKFGFTYVKSASTPIETKKPLLKDPNGEDVDVHLYRDSLFNLVAYSNSDYTGASLDRKSTTGVLLEAQQISNDSPLLGVNTPRCDKDSIELKELMVFIVPICVLRKMELELLLSDASDGFDQILDFLNAHTIKYALLVNPIIYVSCIKQFWTTTIVEKVNGDVQLQALIDDRKVVVTETIIRQDIYLNDTDGVECLSNAESFKELARMEYEKPPPKLKFYKAFFSVQWKFLIHTIVQCISAKRTAWNEFSSSMASAVICLATGRKFNFSKYIFDSMVRNVDSLCKFLMYPRFIQVLLDHQVDDMITHNPRYKSLALTQKVFANMRRDGKGEMAAINANEGTNLVDEETDEEEVALDAECHNDNGSNFDQDEARDEQERADMEKALELQRQLDEREDDIDWSVVAEQNMAGYKMKFFKGMIYDEIRPIFERQHNKIQTLFKQDKDVQKIKKKRVADETLLQESFKKLRAAEVSRSESTQEIPTDDPKEITKEDVQNMLEIVSVPEFRVEALQQQRYMHARLTWRLYSDCGVHHVSSTRGHDIYKLTEKDYPLSKAVMILMLSGKLQVEEENEMARDLVMKIFMEANRSWKRSA